MATMQDHPIDVIRAELARVGHETAQGVMGILTALGLIGALWAGTLKPADAAGQMPAPGLRVTATAQAHLGATPLTMDGSVLAQMGALATASSVCRLVIDPAEAQPVAASCATGLAPVPLALP